MKQTRTYPLEVALDLSPAWGASLQIERVWVRVVPKLDWRVSVCLGEQVTDVICQTRQACMDYLQRHAYPLEEGWLPDLPGQPTQTGHPEESLTCA